MIRSILVLLCVVAIASAFRQFATSSRRNLNIPKMMFGKKVEPVKKIVIKVDNKVIECPEPVNLRKALMANKVDVYPFAGKLNNCGGAGICGTCAVRVLEGASSLNPPSKNEQNTLKGKAGDIRLSCCAKVSGPITIKTKP